MESGEPQAGVGSRSCARSIPAALVAATLASCTSFLGWQPEPEPVQRGPVATRTQQPIKLTYLAFRPRAANTEAEGKLAFSAISQYSNIFENGFSNTERVVIDGELWRNSAVMRYGLTKHSDLEVEIPVMYTSGGFLDNTIEDYHAFFGFPDGGRETRPEDAFQVTVQTHGNTAYELDGYRVGLGDIPIIYTHQILDEDGNTPALAVRVGVELPTGSESAGFGNGKLDVGGGVLAQRTLGRWTLTGAVDYVYPGSSSAFAAAGVDPAQQFDGQFGVEYRWNDGSSLLIGLVLDSPVTRDIHLKEIDNPILSLDVGWAWDVAKRSQIYLGFTEDAISQSGPDITFNFIWKSGF
jgi:hypothetical protein